MIVFLPALASEANAVLSACTIVNTEFTPFTTIYEIERNGNRALLATLGAGKVPAAMTAQYVIDRFAPELLVNFGTCGGVEGEVKLGQLYLVDKCCQYDFDVSAFGDVKAGTLYGRDEVYMPLLTPQGLSDKLPTASLATGDRFDVTEDLCRYIKQNFDCPVRDMEGGAVAQVAEANGVALVMLKGVSDYVGPHSVNMYESNAAHALAMLTDNIDLLFKLEEKL